MRAANINQHSVLANEIIHTVNKKRKTTAMSEKEREQGENWPRNFDSNIFYSCEYIRSGLYTSNYVQLVCCK